MAIIGHERYRTVKENAMQDQKKSQTNAVQIEAGGVSGRAGIDKGNPRPRLTSTLFCNLCGMGIQVSGVDRYELTGFTCTCADCYQGKTKLRHRVLVVPAIDVVDRNVNRGPFTEGY